MGTTLLSMKQRHLMERLCIVCQIYPKRSKTAKTCNQRCAGKLAWQSRGKENE